MMDLAKFLIFAEGLDHPEGVAWGPDGFVYAGGEKGQIYRVNPDDGSYEQIATTSGFALGLCLDGDANIYVCDEARSEVLRITQAGEVSVYGTGSPERALVQPNYPVFDVAGHLYVSDSGGWDEANGCIFRFGADGTVKIVSAQTLPFPNGLALSTDDTALYIVVSNLPGVMKARIHPDGMLGPLEPVVELPMTVPDGLAFDAQDNLYISCYTPDRIYRLSSTSELSILVEDWRRTQLNAPTNITFCGDMLVVANLGGWHLNKAKMDIPGHPLHYPDKEH